MNKADSKLVLWSSGICSTILQTNWITRFQQAFDAELLCAYPDGSGGYMHSELNAYGQILAVSEISEDVAYRKYDSVLLPPWKRP